MRHKRIFLPIFCLMLLTGSLLWAQTQRSPILEIVHESGRSTAIPEGLRFDLFREGSTDTIGSIEYTKIDPNPTDPNCHFTATVRILEDGGSSVTIRNACFVATSLAGRLDPIEKSCVSVPFATFMRAHDPISEEDLVGKFSGRVTDVGYRGLIEMCGNVFILSRGGGYILFGD